MFPSPDEAAKALQAAAAAKNKAGLREIFGPVFDELITGDELQDAENAQKLATAPAQGCKPVKAGTTRSLLRLARTNGRCFRMRKYCAGCLRSDVGWPSGSEAESPQALRAKPWSDGNCFR